MPRACPKPPLNYQTRIPERIPNFYGELGDNTTTDSHVPVAVSGLTSGVSAISACYYTTCAVVNGGVQCWGFNVNGGLGDNTTTDRAVPVQVQFP